MPCSSWIGANTVAELMKQNTQHHIPEGCIHTVMLSDNKVFMQVIQYFKINKMKKWLLERSNAKQLVSKQPTEQVSIDSIACILSTSLKSCGVPIPDS
jgi:hypothetical protein